MKYLITDSRSVFDPQNTIFAALCTNIGDGHDYIPELYAAGMRHFIVEKTPAGEFPDAHFTVVPSVPEHLRHMGAEAAAKSEYGIVITGSHGKTTLKELLYSHLKPHMAVARSPRSWNSRIGVPLAQYDMASTDAAAVFISEAAIDAPGQAGAILRVIGDNCRYGILTPIDTEHDDAFPSHQAKIEEKLAILRECSHIFYAVSDPELEPYMHTLMERGITVTPVQQGSHPSIYHALTAAVAQELGIHSSPDHQPLINSRRRISSVSFDNTVITDDFTPDMRSLREAMDFTRRHATEARPAVLLLGEIMGANDLDYKAIEDMAAKFGFERVIYLHVNTSEFIRQYHSGALRGKTLLQFGVDHPALRAVREALEDPGHDTIMEVNLDALVHNFKHYRSLMPKECGIIAMVKASAYGLGAVEIGKALQNSGAAALAVAVVDEAVELREAGIRMPVMALNPVTNRYPALFAHNIEPTVFSFDELERLISEAEAAGTHHYPVHIKFDTGMHRIGFLQHQISQLVERLAATDAVRVASAFSHLATADCLDKDAATEAQFQHFTAMTDALRKGLGYDFARHILNTAGMMRYADKYHFEKGRLGIGLYGISPFDQPDAALKPVASLYTHIISLKTWGKDTPIGYGGRGLTPDNDTIVATIPIGYADGLNRHLSCGRASFIIRGVECPVIGNICMDLTMIDVTAVPNVTVGDRVEIFGPNMRIERRAAELDTIPYEILTSVAPRVKRVYVKG